MSVGTTELQIWGGGMNSAESKQVQLEPEPFYSSDASG